MLTEAEEQRYAELQAIGLDAARHGQIEILRPMVEAGLPINLKDAKGNSLLMLAAYHGHKATVAMLLELGADPDLRNDREQTPLAGVAFKGDLGVAKLLVEGGADPAADQGGGRTPLMFAAMFGHREMMEYLNGCDAVDSRAVRVFGFESETWVRFAAAVRRLFTEARSKVAPRSKVVV